MESGSWKEKKERNNCIKKNTLPEQNRIEMKTSGIPSYSTPYQRLPITTTTTINTKAQRAKVSYYKSGPTFAQVIFLLLGVGIAGAGLGFAIASFVRTGNNADDLVNVTETLRQELVILIEERIANINNVEGAPPSKRVASEGGIELTGSDGITITNNPGSHSIDITRDVSVIQTRVSNSCNSEQFATSIDEDGTLQCTTLNSNIPRTDSNGMLDGSVLPLSTLQVIDNWNPELNEPELFLSDCNNETYGFFYTISVDSDVERFGYSNWTTNDWLLCTMSGWVQNSHDTPLVNSVNGMNGAIELSYSDLLNRPAPSCPSGQVIESIDANGMATCVSTSSAIAYTPGLFQDSMTYPEGVYSVVIDGQPREVYVSQQIVTTAEGPVDSNGGWMLWASFGADNPYPHYAIIDSCIGKLMLENTANIFPGIFSNDDNFNFYDVFYPNGNSDYMVPGHVTFGGPSSDGTDDVWGVNKYTQDGLLPVTDVLVEWYNEFAGPPDGGELRDNNGYEFIGSTQETAYANIFSPNQSGATPLFTFTDSNFAVFNIARIWVR